MAFGIVLAFVCRPILILVPGFPSAICFGTKVSLSGVRCSAGNGGGAEAVSGGAAGVEGVGVEGTGVDAACSTVGVAVGRASLRILNAAVGYSISAVP